MEQLLLRFPKLLFQIMKIHVLREKGESSLYIIHYIIFQPNYSQTRSWVFTQNNFGLTTLPIPLTEGTDRHLHPPPHSQSLAIIISVVAVNVFARHAYITLHYTMKLRLEMKHTCPSSCWIRREFHCLSFWQSAPVWACSASQSTKPSFCLDVLFIITVKQS